MSLLMINNITYYPKNSLIHKWDPRVKLIAILLLIIISLFKIKFLILSKTLDKMVTNKNDNNKKGRVSLVIK